MSNNTYPYHNRRINPPRFDDVERIKRDLEVRIMTPDEILELIETADSSTKAYIAGVPQELGAYVTLKLK